MNVNIVNLNSVSSADLASAVEKLQTSTVETTAATSSTAVSGSSANITITKASDLEKLLNQLRLENEEKSLEVAKERLAQAAVLIQALGEEVSTMYDTYSAKVTEAETALQEIQEKLETKESELTALQKEITGTLSPAVTSAQSNYDKASAGVTSAQTALDDANSALATLQASGTATAEEIAAATEAVTQATTTLDSAKAKQTEAQTKLTEAQTALTTAQAKETTLKTEISTLKTDETTAEKNVTNAHTALNTFVNTLVGLLNDQGITVADVEHLLETQMDAMEQDDEESETVQTTKTPVEIIMDALRDYVDELRDDILTNREQMV